MKYILIITFISLTPSFALAQAPKETPTSKIEKEVFHATIKAQEVKDQMISSAQFKGCEDKAKKAPNPVEALRECMAVIINKFDEGQLKEFEDKMKVGIYSKEKATSTKSMKEYLSERLDEAVYGVAEADKKKFQKLKDKNIVDHNVFYKLYIEQLGKNTMLHVSQYCFEQFGYDDSKNIIDPQPFQDADGNADFNIRYYPIIEEKVVGTDMTYEIKNIDWIANQSSKPIITSSIFWKDTGNIQEYEICSKDKITDCKDKSGNAGTYSKFRTVKQLDKMKIAEFSLGQSSGKTSPELLYFTNRLNFCTVKVLSNMCEIYKCNNTYTKNSPGDDIKNCESRFNILDPKTRDEPFNPGDSKVGTTSGGTQKGIVACNVLGELKNYRAMLAATEDIKKKLKTAAESKTFTGFSSIKSAGFKDVYTGSQKGNSTDDLTSVSSKDLSTEVDEIAGAGKKAKEIKELCMEEDAATGNFVLRADAKDNSKCVDLMASIDKSGLDQIEIDAEAKTALYLEKVNQLKTEDAVIEFIENSNLKDKLKYKDLTKFDVDKLKAIVAEAYRTEKMSELQAIKKKFHQEARLDDSKTDAQLAAVKNEIAIDNLDDIKEHQRRIANLMQYSNILSSYLMVDDGKKQEANSIGRRLEAENSLGKETEEFTEYFGEGVSSGKGATENSGYLQLIDTVLSGQNKTGK